MSTLKCRVIFYNFILIFVFSLIQWCESGFILKDNPGQYSYLEFIYIRLLQPYYIFHRFPTFAQRLHCCIDAQCSATIETPFHRFLTQILNSVLSLVSRFDKFFVGLVGTAGHLYKIILCQVEISCTLNPFPFCILIY